MLDSIQWLVCCFGNRGEKVSMGHLKEVGIGCINMEDIEQGSKRLGFLYISKHLMTMFQTF